MPQEIEFETEKYLAITDINGIGEAFRLIHNAAMQHDLYPKRYPKCLMYAPQRNKNRCLICSWIYPQKGKLKLYIATQAFSEFYPLPFHEIEEIIGKQGYATLSTAEAQIFATSLDVLFNTIAKNRSPQY